MKHLKRKIISTIFTLIISISMISSSCTEVKASSAATPLFDSPQWITELPAAKDSSQMLVVGSYKGTLSWITLNEKGSDGKWRVIMNTLGYTGRKGMGKVKEGDKKTPVGTFKFNAAFGIAPDPGCQIPYTQATEDLYWSGDHRQGMQYNKLVSTNDYPNLDVRHSEHIINYKGFYQYCLNFSYNEEGDPKRGSALFLHCIGPNRPFTNGCVAIPEDQMLIVMQNVKPDCTVVIDTLENLGGKL